MEKVIVFNVDADSIKKIYKICAQMKICLIVAQDSQKLDTIDKLLQSPLYKGGAVQTGTGESLLLMCNLTDKHFDKLISSIRMADIQLDYKAILTPVNRSWNSVKLLAHMAFEKNNA